MQQHQHQQSQQARSAVSSFPNTSSPRPASSPCSVQSAHPELSTSHAQGASASIPHANQESAERAIAKSGEGLSSTSPFSPQFSDQELGLWLSQKDLGDDFIKNIDLDTDFDLMDEDELPGSNNNNVSSINNNVVDDKSTGSGRALRSSSDVDQKISLPPTRQVSSPVGVDAFNIHLSAKDLQERCKGLYLKGVSNCSIVGDKFPPPAPPEPPKVSNAIMEFT